MERSADFSALKFLTVLSDFKNVCASYCAIYVGTELLLQIGVVHSLILYVRTIYVRLKTVRLELCSFALPAGKNLVDARQRNKRHTGFIAMHNNNKNEPFKLGCSRYVCISELTICEIQVQILRPSGRFFVFLVSHDSYIQKIDLRHRK
jgi:hypothetical protein